MANTNSNTKATKVATPKIDAAALHTRFSWFPDDMKKNTEAQLAGKVVDLTRGTRIIANILRMHLIDLSAIAAGDTDVHPLLNPADIQDLAGLLEVSLDTLCDIADRELESVTDQAAKGPKA